jgi:hypothetical protein
MAYNKMNKSDSAPAGWKFKGANEGYKSRSNLGVSVGGTGAQEHLHVPQEKNPTPGLAYKTSLKSQLEPGPITGVFK